MPTSLRFPPRGAAGLPPDVLSPVSLRVVWSEHEAAAVTFGAVVSTCGNILISADFSTSGALLASGAFVAGVVGDEAGVGLVGDGAGSAPDTTLKETSTERTRSPSSNLPVSKRSEPFEPAGQVSVALAVVGNSTVAVKDPSAPTCTTAKMSAARAAWLAGSTIGVVRLMAPSSSLTAITDPPPAGATHPVPRMVMP